MSPIKTKKHNKIKDVVLQYFNITNGKAMCIIDKCEKELKSELSFNLKRHIMNHHPLIAEENGWNKKNCSNDFPLKEYIVHHNRESIIINSVKLVTKDGMPFSIFEYESFKNIVQPLYDAANITINSTNIVNRIETTSNSFKDIIMQKLKNKFISLKMDGASRHNKSIVGINAQYIEDGQVNIFTLSMMEMTNSHTGENLKEHVLEVLQEYNIKLSQIYSCTTDNGANMVKTVKLLNIELYDNENTSNVIDVTQEPIIFADDISIVQSIRCAAHTLQLAIIDAVKVIELDKTLGTIRSIVKKLRTPNIHHEFVSNKKKQIPLDTSTRWNSTFEMLDAMLEQQHFIGSVLQKYNVQLLENFRDVLPKMIMYQKTLKPAAVATKLLQDNQLTLGDLYKVWLELELDLEENVIDEEEENIFTDELIKSMKRRKKNLFENEIFLAAIFLDPRFNYKNSQFLSSNELKQAKDHLIRLKKRIENMEPSRQNEYDAFVQDGSTDAMLSEPPKKISKLEKKLQESELNSVIGTYLNQQFEVKLDNLCNRERFPIEGSVLSYWEHLKHDTDLYNLSQIVLATPATQVSVERAFSGLAQILISSRTNLKKENLNNILIVKLNHQLFKEINLDIYKD